MIDDVSEQISDWIPVDKSGRPFLSADLSVEMVRYCIEQAPAVEPALSRQTWLHDNYCSNYLGTYVELTDAVTDVPTS